MPRGSARGGYGAESGGRRPGSARVPGCRKRNARRPAKMRIARRPRTPATPYRGIFRVGCRLNVCDRSRETFRRDEQVALDHESLDLAPVDRLQIEAETHPAVVVHVRGPVETARILGDQRLAPAALDLAHDALDSLVSPVVDEVVGERPAAHAKAGVAGAHLPLGLGQAETDLREPVEGAAQWASPRRTSCGGPQASRS